MIAFKVTCCDLKIGFCAVNKTEKNTHHTVARQKVKMPFRYRCTVCSIITAVMLSLVHACCVFVMHF